jgi:hypothetical protein
VLALEHGRPGIYNVVDDDPAPVRETYWQALDDAINERDCTQRLQGLVNELEAAGYTAGPDAWPTTSTRSSCTCATRPDTAADGEAPTCSSDHWARSSGERR